MEQDNKALIFEVISGDDVVILEAITSYNNLYKTDFEVTEFIYDEVVFARIKVSMYKISDMFSPGYYFNSAVAKARQEGKIDW